MDKIIVRHSNLSGLEHALFNVIMLTLLFILTTN